jgi:ketosteroid isomerase-like protein
MYTKVLFFIVLLPIAIHTIHTEKHQNFRNDEKSEFNKISKTINSCIGWFENKDFELLYNVIANDSNYISVHPTDNVIKGFDQFKNHSGIYRNPNFKYVKHEIRDLHINISSSGDIAWFYCILDDINTWNGKAANWEDTRWTGVLEKRSGIWVIVQQHFSFAKEKKSL